MIAVLLASLIAGRLFDLPAAMLYSPATDWASQSLIRATVMRSDQDGRFSLDRPASGPFRIPILDGAHGRGATRGPAALMWPGPRRLTVRLLENLSCTLSADGPIGSFGPTTIHAARFGPLHLFEVPEPGIWGLAAECAGRRYALMPGIVDVPASGPVPSLDVRLVK